MRNPYKTLNVRLEEPTYDALRALAVVRGTSMNKVIEEEIERAAKEERKRRLRVAFERIASSDHDVEFGFSAQSEVVLDQG